MATSRELITDFSFGAVSDRFSGRIDSELRRHAVQTMVGFIPKQDGGVRRVPAQVFVRDNLGISVQTDRLYDANGIPGFIVYRDSGDPWMAWLSSASYYVAENLTNSSSMTITSSSFEYGHELWTGGSYVDPADDVEHLLVWTPDDSFGVSLTSDLMSRPTDYDLGVVFQNRFIGIKRDTGAIVASVVKDYTDFTTSSGGLTGVPDWAGSEEVWWITARRGLYIGTHKSEHEMYSQYGYFSEEDGGLQLSKMGGIGSRRAVYFGREMAIMRENGIVVYSRSGDAYNTAGLTVQIDAEEWITIESIDYGTHQYLVGLTRDGDLWLYTRVDSSNIRGWSKIRGDVGWVTVYENDLFIAYENSTEYRVDVIGLDELVHPGDRTSLERRAYRWCDVHGEGGGYLTVGSSVSGDLLPTSSTMAVWTLSSTGPTYAGTLATQADGTFVTSSLQTLVGWTSSTIYTYAYVDGEEQTSQIITLPLTAILGKMHNLSKVYLQVWNSMGARVRIYGNDLWDQQVEDALYTGVWEFDVEGTHDEDPQIEVQALSSLPLNIYAIYAEVEVGDT